MLQANAFTLAHQLGVLGRATLGLALQEWENRSVRTQPASVTGTANCPLLWGLGKNRAGGLKEDRGLHGAFLSTGNAPEWYCFVLHH